MKTINSLDITPHFTEFGKLVLPSTASLHVQYNLNRNLPMPQFCYCMTGNLDNILNINSAAALKLYYILLNTLGLQKEVGCTVQITTEILSKKLNIDQPAISRALKLLIANKLIITKNRKSIKLSPKYAWRGSLKPWQEEVAKINLEELEIIIAEREKQYETTNN